MDGVDHVVAEYLELRTQLQASEADVDFYRDKWNDANNQNKNLKVSNYVQIMKDYNVKTCLYGHLHGESHKEAFEGIIDGINFKLVSSDYLDFKLYKLE